MIIPREVFLKFYYDLLYYYRENSLRADEGEWLNGFGHQHKDDSKEWWFVQRTVNKRTLFVSLEITASAEIFDNWIFYRIYTKYGIDKIHKTELLWSMKELRALGSALRYIGRNVSKELLPDFKLLAKKEFEVLEAKALFQYYLQDKFVNDDWPDFLLRYPNLVLLKSNHNDRNSTQPVFDGICKREPNLPPSASSELNSEDNLKERIASARSFIDEYYEAISKSEFKVALNCWVDSFAKHRWHDSYYEFGRKHFETLDYSILFCDIQLRANKNQGQCIVLVSETAFVCSTPEYLQIDSWPPSLYAHEFASKFEQKINDSKASSVDDNVLNSLRIYDKEIHLMRKMMRLITEPSDREQIKKSIPNSFKRDVNRIFLVFVTFENGMWKIEGADKLDIDEYRRFGEQSKVIILGRE
jgi:hypothetical protein